jgi:DNA mismatch repair protein MutS
VLFRSGDLFAPPPAPEPAINSALEMLLGIDPDALTPRQALDVLYELRGLL